MNSKNSNLIGIVLLVFLWAAYLFYTSPSAEEVEAERQAFQAQQDSIALVDSLAKIKATQASSELLAIEQDTSLSTAQRDSLTQQVVKQELGSKFGPFALAAKGVEKAVVVENEKMRITFNSKGGKIAKVELKEYLQYNQATKEDVYDKEQLLLMDNKASKFGYFIPVSGVAKGSVSTEDLFFEPTVEGNTVTMRAYSDDRKRHIEQRYTLGDTYIVDYQLGLENIDELMPRNQNVELNWVSYVNAIERNPEYEGRMTSIHYKESEENPDYCNCVTDDNVTTEQPVKWVSHAQQFFNTSLVATKGTMLDKVEMATKTVKPEEVNYLKELYTTASLLSNDSKTYDFQFYIGPNEYENLTEIGVELERIIPFGWSIFGWISRSVIRPLFNFFALFISNYGFIILLLTLLIRLLLFPLQYKMLLNGVKMSILKPELEAMRKRNKDNPQGMQMEQMKLYQAYGVNPLGGCLPMVLTMPIWIALYRFFPASIAFRQKSFLWADDLVSYDSILDLGFYVPFYGDHVSLFTLLWMLSMFAYLWYNSKQMDMSAAGQNAKMMKVMQFGFPVIFFFALNNYAAGLTAYMLFSNLSNILQTFITKNVLINKDNLKAKMEENKKNGGGQKGMFAKYGELLQQQQEMQNQQKKGK